MSVASVAILGVVWVGWITPDTTASGSGFHPATPAQMAALRSEVHQAFGSHYPLTSAQFAGVRPGASTGFLTANLGPDSSIQMSWPDRTSVTYALDMASGHPEPATLSQGPRAAPPHLRQRRP